MKQKIVVTGADGFIGRHFLKRLADSNFEIYALTDPASQSAKRICGIDGVKVLPVHFEDWEDALESLPQNPVAFVHLAWKGVAPEFRNSTLLQKSNIDMSLSAVQLAGRLSSSRFVLLGSTMEYALSGQVINATTPPAPQNAYGAVKVATRFLCASLCEELKIPFIYAVATGIYAPDRKDNNVIYYTIAKLLRKERPSLTKLEQLWDYVYIDDAIEALYLIATKGKGGAFYSIGHGDNWALANYIYKIRDLIDPSLPLGIGEVPYKDDSVLPCSCVDLTSLRCDTGFVPKVTFEEGIAKVINSLKSQI